MNGEWSVYKNSFRPSHHTSQYTERLIIHSRTKALYLPRSFSLPLPDPAKALPSRLHKLHNVQCRNKVDRLRTIHLFSYFVKFSFCLPPLSLSLFFSLFFVLQTDAPLNFYDHSRREWRTTRMTIENDDDDDDDDIGIPLTSANYTSKIDLPMVHIEKFPQDTRNLWKRVAAKKHGSWVG